MSKLERYVILIFICALVVFSGALYAIYVEVRSQTIDDWNDGQFVHAQQAAEGIREYLNHVVSTLQVLSRIPAIIEMNDTGKRMLSEYQRDQGGELSGITRVDERGLIEFTVPVLASIGQDISHQDHIRRMQQYHEPVVSDVFMAVQGFRTIAVHVPVFRQGHYDGTIAFLLSFDRIAKKYVENVRLGASGFAWIVSERGIEISSPFKNHIGMNVRDVYRDYESVVSMIDRILRSERGTAVYAYRKSSADSLHAVTYRAVFLPLTVHNTRWSIIVTTPEEEILASLAGFRQKIVVITVTSLILCAICFYLMVKYRIINEGQKKRENLIQALRESEQRFQILAENSPVGIFQTDLHGSTIYVNPRWCEMSGLKMAEASGDGWLEALPEEDAKRVQKEWNDATIEQRASHSEYRFIRKDGTVAWVIGQAIPRRNSRNEVIGYVGTTTEITEHKKAEDRLHKLNHELTALNVLSQQVSQSISLDQVVNETISGLLKATDTDIAFLFIREDERLILLGFGPTNEKEKFGMIPEHRVGECMCGLAARNGIPMYSSNIFKDLRCTWQECKKAGYLSFAALPLKYSEQVIGVVGLASDTERDFEEQSEFLETLASQVSIAIQNARLHTKIQHYAAELEMRVTQRTEELNLALQKATEADQLKSAFLATMSHELRTPLNSIIGFTGILLQNLPGPLTDEQRKQLGMVQNSARHLLALINDVLDISKIEAGQRELTLSKFDLKPMLYRVLATIEPLAKIKGLQLHIDIAPDIGGLESDQRRVEQILLNLLNNAVKFTEHGFVSLSCAMEGHSFVVHVADTGIGIREEDLGKLFVPFSQVDTGLTRSHEGTGLGLSICKRLVGMLGGQISVTSTFNVGSTFTISMPLRSPHFDEAHQ